MSEQSKLIMVGIVLAFLLGLAAVACEWHNDAACIEAIKLNAKAWCF